MPRCGYCRRPLPTTKGVRAHVQNAPRCRRKWERQLARVAQAVASSGNIAAAAAVVAAASDRATSGHDNADHSSEISSHQVDIDDPMDGSQSSRYRTQVEDVPEDEEDARRYVENYPGVVATIIREDDTLFEKWCAMRAEAEADEWAPFEDEEEWELFRW